VRAEGVTNRIIYIVHNLDDGVVCEILAIGRRRDGEAHGTAAKRL
jgi:hypothetical protein